MKYTDDDKTVSKYVWLPTIWLIINSSRILMKLDLKETVDVSTSNIAGGDIKGQIVYSILIILGIICLTKRKIFLEKKILLNNLFLFLFIFYMAASISWSDYPVTSIKRYIKTVGILIQVLVILTEVSPTDALITVFKRTYITIITTSAILVFLVPSQGITPGGSWVGATSNKNHLGEVSCVGAIFFLYKISKYGINWENKYYIILFILAAILLFNTDSMTSVVIFAFSTSLFALFKIRLNSRYTSVLLLYTYIFSLTVLVFLNNLFPEGLLGKFLGAIGRDMTFTGRDELWEDVLRLAEKHQWLGFGYESFWIGDIHNLWEIYIWRPNQSHNGYIDIYVSLGIIGLILFFIMALSSFINISNQFHKDYDLSQLRLIYFIVAFWFNISESSFCVSSTSLWVLFLYVCANHASRRST